MTSKPHLRDRGPFVAEQLHPGDPYELSHGHPVYCAPTGGRGARSSVLGALALGMDPAGQDVGMDTGYSPEPGVLRAPDLSVGVIPDKPGWVAGAPLLAIEYADTGQDEATLADKIADLLAAGTRQIWVVRLEGQRRVEVHQPGQPMRLAFPGEMLAVPGVLQNPVRVEALYEREAAEEAALTNLLQARGYASLEAVQQEGKKQGLDEGKKQGLDEGKRQGLVQAVRDLCEALGIELAEEQEAALAAMDLPQLDTVRAAIKRERRWPH